MVHGTPDWGGSAPKATTYKLDDQAELAVRLGSMVSYDRRGEVIWANDFAGGGRSFFCVGAGVGEEIYLTCEGALSGGLCLALKTGNVVGDFQRVYQFGYYTVEGGLGQEVWFAPMDNRSEFILQTILYNDLVSYEYALKYSYVNQRLYIYDDAGAWQAIGSDVGINFPFEAYTPVKMVIDTLKRRYVRVLFGGYHYDVSGYTPLVGVTGVRKSMLSCASIEAVVAGGAVTHVDNWIVTQNEPVT